MTELHEVQVLVADSQEGSVEIGTALIDIRRTTDLRTGMHGWLGSVVASERPLDLFGLDREVSFRFRTGEVLRVSTEIVVFPGLNEYVSFHGAEGSPPRPKERPRAS